MIKKQERYNYIDICKAIGIILVILGHTHNISHKLYIAIYSFHMPLFFIISGLVFNSIKNHKMGFKNYFILKFKQYIIPYFVFSFINLIIDMLWKSIVLSQSVDISYLSTKLKGILLCYSNIKNMPNCSPLWFLVCLFFSCIILWWITKLNNKFSWIPILLCVVIYYFLIPFSLDITNFPFKFPTFLIAVFFMYIGYIFQLISKCNTISSLNKKIYSIIIFILSLSVSVILNNKVGINDNIYSNFIIFIITSIFSSLSFITIFKEIDLNSKFLLWLGKNTIYVIAFNYVCRTIIEKVFAFIPTINKIINSTIMFILTFMFCLVVILICERVKLFINHNKK